MNDFGVFQAIQERIRSDEMLSQKVTAVTTEPRPGMQAPHMRVRFIKSEVHIPCLVQTALVSCEIDITSTYHGDQEIHDLMSRLNQSLDGAALPVNARALEMSGTAVFKQTGQSVKSDKGMRIGTLKYQVKVNIRRNEQ